MPERFSPAEYSHEAQDASRDAETKESPEQTLIKRLSSVSLSKELRASLLQLQEQLGNTENPRSLFAVLTSAMGEFNKYAKMPGQAEAAATILDTLAYIRSHYRASQDARAVFQRIIERQKERFNEQQKIEKRFVAQLELLLLKYCEKVNEGKNGVIFRMDPKTVPAKILSKLKEQGLDLAGSPGQAAAVKMFKVFSPENVQHEYAMQQQAYSMAGSADPKDFAGVPRPWFTQDLDLTDQKTIRKMEEAGVLQHRASSDQVQKERKVSVLIMDYVSGEDIATHLYKWILKHRNFDKDQVEKMTFEELQGIVQHQLGFEKPKPGSAEQEDFQIANENSKKIFKFLSAKGFVFNPEISRQVRNTVRLMHKNKFYHNDLHFRNIMVKGNIEKTAAGETARSFLIDFGTADKTTHDSDDLAALLTLEKYTEQG